MSENAESILIEEIRKITFQIKGEPLVRILNALKEDGAILVNFGECGTVTACSHEEIWDMCSKCPKYSTQVICMVNPRPDLKNRANLIHHFTTKSAKEVEEAINEVFPTE